MNDQLTHLINLADNGDAVLQVLPLSSGEHPGARGPFAILGFGPESDLQVVYVEGNRLEACVEDQHQVDIYKRDYDHLRAKALGPDETVRLLKTTLAKGSR
jgi:hypothetical protein